MIRDIALGIARHLLTGAGGWLVAHDVLHCATKTLETCSDFNGWLGSTLFLAGVAWSAWEKYGRNRL